MCRSDILADNGEARHSEPTKRVVSNAQLPAAEANQQNAFLLRATPCPLTAIHLRVQMPAGHRESPRDIYLQSLQYLQPPRAIRLTQILVDQIARSERMRWCRRQ